MVENKFLQKDKFEIKIQVMKKHLHIKHFLLFLVELVRGALKAGETFWERVKPMRNPFGVPDQVLYDHYRDELLASIPRYDLNVIQISDVISYWGEPIKPVAPLSFLVCDGNPPQSLATFPSHTILGLA